MSNPISKSRGTFALAALLLTTALLTNAQAPSPPTLPQSTAPTLHVYSRETIIDVLVTDDKGQPVRGLKQSDFTVEEDSKPQPIRSFAEYDKATPPPPPHTLPPNTYNNSTALPANGPVQIFYISLPCPPMQRGRPESYIADYLRTMPTGTQVAIFGYRADLGLRLVQGFTIDGPRAAASIDNLALPVCKLPWADPIAAADQIAAYVAGIHGRKNLIWIGNPLPIMRDGGYSWSKSPDMIYVHRLMDTYDTFTREQIAIYPFDPRGVVVGEALNYNSLRVEDIATETGGVAIYNTNDFKGAVAKIVDDTLNYYTLAYVPPRPADDGHYHPVKVSVDRPGLHLTYRSGYNDEHPAPADAILKVHMAQDSTGLGALPATQILFDLHVEPASDAPSHAKTLPYNTIFTFDPTQLSLSESPDGTRIATIELDLGAYDSFGLLVSTRSQPFKISVTPAQYAGFIHQRLKFPLAIDLPHGQLTLHAGLFDTVANKAGTLEIPLTIPKKGAP